VTEEQPTRAKSTIAAIIAAIGVGLSAYLVLGVCEMFAVFDGIGYGHRDFQTWVSWSILAVVLLLVAIAAVGSFKGQPGYSSGALLVVWFGFFFPVMRTYGLHYDLVCDTVDAPWACYAGSGGSCTSDEDPECFRRLKRSCDLGLSRACERLVEQGAMTESEICETLAIACDYTQQCAKDPEECGRRDLPRLEEYFFSESLCQDYEKRCEFLQ